MSTKKLSTISAVCEVFEKRAFSALNLTKKSQNATIPWDKATAPARADGILGTTPKSTPKVNSPSSGSSYFGHMPSYEFHPTVANIQQQLRDAGFNPGKIDGKLGQNTIQAMKNWAEKNNVDTNTLPEIIDFNTELSMQRRNRTFLNQLEELTKDNSEESKTKGLNLLNQWTNYSANYKDTSITNKLHEIVTKINSGEIPWRREEIVRALMPVLDLTGSQSTGEGGIDQYKKIMEFSRIMDSKKERPIPGPTATASTHLNEMLKLADHFAKKL